MKKNNNQATTKITLWEITYRDDIENVIRELNPSEYAYILHDKDKELDGKSKKPHYHIWCRWETPVRNSMITKVLGLSDKYSVKTARSRKACIKYLTHETAEAKAMGKYKYDRALIVTNLPIDEINRIFSMEDNIKNDIKAIMDILLTAERYNQKQVEEYNRAIDKCDEETLGFLNLSTTFKEKIEFDMFILQLLELDLMDTYNKYYNSVFNRIVKKIWG